MATHAHVYFPIPQGHLCEESPHTHFMSQAWSNGFLDGVGRALWRSTCMASELAELSFLACGYLPYYDPATRCFAFKEADYMDFEEVDLDHEAFRGLGRDEFDLLVEEMKSSGWPPAELGDRLARIGIHDRFGGTHGFGEANSRLCHAGGDDYMGEALSHPQCSAAKLVESCRRFCLDSNLGFFDALAAAGLDCNDFCKHAFFEGRLFSLVDGCDGLLTEPSWVPTILLLALFCKDTGDLSPLLRNGICRADLNDLDELFRGFPNERFFCGSPAIDSFKDALLLERSVAMPLREHGRSLAL